MVFGGITMSRYKFRVFDRQKNKYIETIDDDLNIALDMSGSLLKVDWSEYDNRSNDLYNESLTDGKPRYIIQFCTGLKDRDGKEIYEGDILEYTTTRSIKIVVKIEYYNYKLMVYVLGMGEYWGLLELLDFQEKCTFKIIGNVFETPELLEE